MRVPSLERRHAVAPVRESGRAAAKDPVWRPSPLVLVFVDKGKSMEVYREWHGLTRSSVEHLPNGLLRPTG